MKQLEAENLQPERVHLGAFVDRELADKLTAIACQEDRSVSSIIRRAVGELVERERSDQA